MSQTDPTWSESVRQVRLRPGMYLGASCYRVIRYMSRELVANALDLFLAGTASSVGVGIDGKMVTVFDDGPGLPIEPSKALDPSVEALTTLHLEGSMDGHAPHVHLLTIRGAGMAAVNAASASFVVRAWRDGTRWERRFERGVPIGGARKIDTGTGRGTSFQFVADADLFGDVTPRPTPIRADLFLVAHLVRGLKVHFRDESFHAPAGLADLAPVLMPEWQGLLQNQEPAVHVIDRRDGVEVEAYVAGRRVKRSRRIHSWVNGATTTSGSHVRGLSDALTKANWSPAIALLHVVMHDPEFAGPTREDLDVPRVRRVVRDLVLGAIERQV